MIYFLKLLLKLDVITFESGNGTLFNWGLKMALFQRDEVEGSKHP